VLTGKEPLVAGLKKAFDSTRGGGENTVRAGRAALSYETMNRDTGVFPRDASESGSGADGACVQR